MPVYKMLVLSRPTTGQEAEYNDWYQNTHLQQIVSLPGFVAAQRFKLAVNMRGEDSYPYMAIYDIEADNAEIAYQTLQEASSSGSIIMSPALDKDTIFPSIYEPLGEVVTEP